jgi:ubiquinone/menaquinone biosynthesis C-methylase UbiE
MPGSPKSSADPFSERRPDPRTLGTGGRIRLLAASALTVLLRIAFHLLYHQLAFMYDAVAWIVSAGEWTDWRRCVLPYLPPGRLLEVAHGTGTLSLDMADRGHSVTAVDLSPAMGSIALGKIRRRRRKSPGRPTTEPVLVRADVQKLPFRSGAFSAATATFPADFVFQAATLREMHRALRSGGRWIMVPSAFPEWIAKRWLPENSPITSDAFWRPMLDRLEQCGFQARMEIVRRPRSRVLLIIAEKL